MASAQQHGYAPPPPRRHRGSLPDDGQPQPHSHHTAGEPPLKGGSQPTLRGQAVKLTQQQQKYCDDHAPLHLPTASRQQHIQQQHMQQQPLPHERPESELSEPCPHPDCCPRPETDSEQECCRNAKPETDSEGPYAHHLGHPMQGQGHYPQYDGHGTDRCCSVTTESQSENSQLPQLQLHQLMHGQGQMEGQQPPPCCSEVETHSDTEEPSRRERHPSSHSRRSSHSRHSSRSRHSQQQHSQHQHFSEYPGTTTSEDEQRYASQQPQHPQEDPQQHYSEFRQQQYQQQQQQQHEEPIYYKSRQQQPIYEQRPQQQQQQSRQQQQQQSEEYAEYMRQLHGGQSSRSSSAFFTTTQQGGGAGQPGRSPRNNFGLSQEHVLLLGVGGAVIAVGVAMTGFALIIKAVVVGTAVAL